MSPQPHQSEPDAADLEAQADALLAAAEPPLPKHYFINERVEWLLTVYLWTGCTDVAQRDRVMAHATELIRQIIRKQGLHTIYPGQEESAFGDLLQVGWCVTPDTLVTTGTGISPIGDVLPPGGAGDCSGLSVHGLEGMAEVERYVRRPPTKTHRITTKFSYAVEATGDHPLLVLTEAGPEWVTASQIGPGDLLAVQAGQMRFGADDTIEIPRPARHAHCEWWPTAFTPDLAYIIGLFIAEGSVDTNRVTIYNYDPQVIDFLVRDTCGLGFHHVGDGRTVCDRTRFVDFLRWLGFHPGEVNCYNKHIPDRMLRCSEPIVTAMLRGMFDGDGHSCRYDGTVGYSSSSLALINRLRVLLLNYGIYTKTCTSERGEVVGPKGWKHTAATAHQLTLSTIDSATYYDRIGFGIDYKQAKRVQLSQAPFRLIDPVTTRRLQGHVRKLAKADLLKAGFRKHALLQKQQLTEETFRRVMAAVEFGDQFLSDRLAEISSTCRLRWVPVRSVVDGWSETVDIRVRDVHNFTANGIITHNCQLERVLYKYRARPHCRACFNPDRPNDSVLYQPGGDEYGIKTIPELIALGIDRCPRCGVRLAETPVVEARQGCYGGSETVLYKGISKVFNLWSQVSRTVILAYIKKEGRDRKNSGSYTSYLDNRHRPLSDVMVRFLHEARELCKYNDSHLLVLDSLEYLLHHDSKPYDGIIAKLVEHSGQPRQTVTQLMRLIRLRSGEFTDSPLNREVDQHRAERRRISHGEFEEDS